MSKRPRRTRPPGSRPAPPPTSGPSPAPSGPPTSPGLADTSTAPTTATTTTTTATPRTRARKTTRPARRVQQQSFFDRYRGLLLGGFALLGLGIIALVFFQSATARAYTCETQMTPGPTEPIPTPTPTFVPTPTASPTEEPASEAPSASAEGSPSTSPEATPSSSASAPTTSPEGSPSTSPETSPSGEPSTSPETSPSGEPSTSLRRVPRASPAHRPKRARRPNRARRLIRAHRQSRARRPQRLRASRPRRAPHRRQCPHRRRSSASRCPTWVVGTSSRAHPSRTGSARLHRDALSGRRSRAAAPSVLRANAGVVPGNWVHNLEHGWIVVAYRDPEGADGPTADELAAMRTFFETAPASTGTTSAACPNKVIVVRFDDMASRVRLYRMGPDAADRRVRSGGGPDVLPTVGR